MFSTSVEKYNLQYTEYLGDGDSKSYKVCLADPYGKPIRKECIGHIQKRVGGTLRNLKANGLFKDLYDDGDDDDDDDDDSSGKKKPQGCISPTKI